MRDLTGFGGLSLDNIRSPSPLPHRCPQHGRIESAGPWRPHKCEVKGPGTLASS